MQMPFLLDLHLYLSRPLQPAPVQPLHQAAAAAAALSNDVSMFGTIPQVSMITQPQHVLTACLGRFWLVVFPFSIVASESQSGIQ